MKEIPLTQDKVALVDDEDYDYLIQFKWYAHHRGNTFYAERKVNKRNVFMHRVVFPKETNHLLDHIDGNGLNNQKNNLRESSKRENAQNLHISKTSKYPGVSLERKSGKWAAFIRIKGKRKNLGKYKLEESAHQAYQSAVMLL